MPALEYGIAHKCLNMDLSVSKYENGDWLREMTSDLLKFQLHLFPMMYIEIQVFWVKEFKYDIVFLIWPLRDHQMTFDLWSEYKIQIYFYPMMYIEI